MRRLSTSLLLIALLGVPLAVCAQVYKWTDAHGTVHYADTPPAHGKTYKNVKITGISTVSAPHPEKEHSDAGDQSPSVAATTRMQDTPANRKKLCDNLSANLDLLKQDGPVFLKDKNGKPRMLSKQRRAQELAKSQKQYQTYCHSPKA